MVSIKILSYLIYNCFYNTQDMKMFTQAEWVKRKWFILCEWFRDVCRWHLTSCFAACLFVYGHEHVGNLPLHNPAVTKVTSPAGCVCSSMVTSSRLRLIFRHFVNSRMGDMSSKSQLPTPETALSGRPDSMKVAGKNDAASSRMLTLA